MPQPLKLGEAIRLGYGRKKQWEVAEAIGTTQGTISRWCRGESAEPSLDQIAAIEAFAGRPRGWILRAAGYVEDSDGVEAALAADPLLSDEARDLLTITYRGAVKRGRRRSR